MHTEIVPGEAEYIHNTSYYIPNRTKLNALVKEMFGEYLINKQNGNSQVDTENNNNKNNNKNNNTNNNNSNTNKNNKNNNNNNNNNNNR